MRESNKIFQNGIEEVPQEAQNIQKSVDVNILDWEVPVDIVPLPSEGKVYSPSTGMNNAQGLEIKAMTAKEEDILMSQALIKKGTVIKELVKSCLTNKHINVNDMLIGDRDALMVSIRITGYGSRYVSDVNCPKCGIKNEEHPFDLSDLGIKPLELNPEIDGVNEFSFNLPVSKKRVTFKFLTSQDDENLAIEESRKRKLLGDQYIHGSVTTSLFAHILSVSSVRDRNQIKRFVDNMPALDSSSLRKYINQNRPGLDMSLDFRCSSCNMESRVDLPIGFTFFWPAL